jgi:hypothetical protein
MEDFLKLIKPDLTLIATLFGFLILFLQLFWRFLNYEDKLRDENLSRVKDLNFSFRKKHIEKKISEWYIEIKTNTFKWAIDTFSNDFFIIETNEVDGTIEKKIKAIGEIGEVLNPTNLQNKIGLARKDIEKETSEYFYSTLGQDFFNSLDLLYNKKDKINNMYHRMILYCRTLWWSCLIMSIMSIIGVIIQLIGATDTIIHFWVFTYFLFFSIGAFSFAVLFYKRNRLVTYWETKQLFSDEE